MSLRALIVDDDGIDIKLLLKPMFKILTGSIDDLGDAYRMLKSGNTIVTPQLEIYHERSIDKGLKAAENYRLHLALVDTELGFYDGNIVYGFNHVREFRARLPALYIIGMSADSKYREMWLKNDANDFFKKYPDEKDAALSKFAEYNKKAEERAMQTYNGFMKALRVSNGNTD